MKVFDRLTDENLGPGQMTVLLRQAGSSVPGVMGPAKEEWTQMGMEAAAVLAAQGVQVYPSRLRGRKVRKMRFSCRATMGRTWERRRMQ